MAGLVIDGSPSAPAYPAMPLPHVAAVVVGNALEFFDFVSYSFFSIYIGRAFFPTHSASLSLILSLSAFGMGFVSRPIGAIVIGSWGDRAGRKPAMLFSFGLMGVGIIGLALTPSYARIGIAAPILAVLFRLLQGFALGGNVGPATAYMVEAAPPLRRGFYAAMQSASQDSGALAAGVIATVLASVLDAQQLQDWGWRATMLVGACIVPFGLMLRRSLPETLHGVDDAALAPDATAGTLSVRTKLQPHLLMIVLGLMILAAGTIANYTISYMTTYALDTLRMQAKVAFGVIIVSGVLSICADLVSGLLADKFGRKPVMLVPGAVLAATILPAFWAIGHFHTTFVFYTAVGWLAVVFCLSTGPVLVMLTETLPRSVRAGAVSTIYAFAIAIFGGSTQVTVKSLIVFTGNPLAPAYYWTGAAVIGLAAMAFVRESAPIKLIGRRR
ncbi:MAG: MFS transporter [Rhizomicrobium sp.]|jgi:MFS family permease